MENCIHLFGMVCLAKEMQDFFIIKRDPKGRCGI